MSTIQTLSDQDFRDIVRLLKIARGAAMRMDFRGSYAEMKRHNLARQEFEDLMAEWIELDRLIMKLSPDDWR